MSTGKVMLLELINAEKQETCMYKFRTWPGTNTFPLYSTGSNGLPLAKIARPCRFKKIQEREFVSLSTTTATITLPTLSPFDGVWAGENWGRMILQL